ncbi:Protein NETWORKED 1A [Arachis hypogaea]|nr:Protein NETWORKED 1A [Arachis hypogaea]
MIKSKGEKLESEKKTLNQEPERKREHNTMLQKDKVELQEMNKQLNSEVTHGEEKENTLKAKLAVLHVEVVFREKDLAYVEDEEWSQCQNPKLVVAIAAVIATAVEQRRLLHQRISRSGRNAQTKPLSSIEKKRLFASDAVAAFGSAISSSSQHCSSAACTATGLARRRTRSSLPTLPSPTVVAAPLFIFGDQTCCSLFIATMLLCFSLVTIATSPS